MPKKKSTQKTAKSTKKSSKTKANYKTRRVVAAAVGVAAVAGYLIASPNSYETVFQSAEPNSASSREATSVGSADNEAASEPASESGRLNPKGVSSSETSAEKLAVDYLEKLAVKGRAPKTGYSREEFYNSWPSVDGCSLRQRIIKRELGDSAVLSSEDNCTVISGEYDEPYTGSHLVFYQKSDLSSGVQIDHVVALSDAWQKGARELSKEERYSLATDPLNLLAVDSKTNMGKSDGDASTWLPPNKKFRCQYVARQISVKYKYSLWISAAEKSTMKTVLETCPKEPVIGV
ncbi:HNH endonuclease [Candidatus Saccharibacteria bacterium]|nr:HNH endonuclease [Candidatus Saccharibacteria bacterium]MBQ6605929.1 HNH endonuclease [Candidatus Saccharibacteria bacterium]